MSRKPSKRSRKKGDEMPLDEKVNLLLLRAKKDHAIAEADPRAQIERNYDEGAQKWADAIRDIEAACATDEMQPTSQPTSGPESTEDQQDEYLDSEIEETDPEPQRNDSTDSQSESPHPPSGSGSGQEDSSGKNRKQTEDGNVRSEKSTDRSATTTKRKKKVRFIDEALRPEELSIHESRDETQDAADKPKDEVRELPPLQKLRDINLDLSKLIPASTRNDAQPWPTATSDWGPGLPGPFDSGTSGSSYAELYLPGPSHAAQSLPGPSYATPSLPGPSYATPSLPGPSYATLSFPGPSCANQQLPGLSSQPDRLLSLPGPSRETDPFAGSSFSPRSIEEPDEVGATSLMYQFSQINPFEVDSYVEAFCKDCPDGPYLTPTEARCLFENRVSTGDLEEHPIEWDFDETPITNLSISDNQFEPQRPFIGKYGMELDDNDPPHIFDPYTNSYIPLSNGDTFQVVAQIHDTPRAHNTLDEHTVENTESKPTHTPIEHQDLEVIDFIPSAESPKEMRPEVDYAEAAFQEWVSPPSPDLPRRRHSV